MLDHAEEFRPDRRPRSEHQEEQRLPRQALWVLIDQDRAAPVRNGQRRRRAHRQNGCGGPRLGEALGRRLIQRASDRDELLVERGRPHQAAATSGHAQSEGPVQAQAFRIAREHVGERLCTHDPFGRDQVISEA